MPQNFIECDREQAFLLPPSLRDWLPEDHLAWFVIEAVRRLDLRAFYAAYRADGHGRAAYEPSMVVGLVLYAYSTDERSSRGIERRCRQDIAYRVITGNVVPDHATIARFIRRHQRSLNELFGAVLRLCARAGLVSSGVVAVDGTKLTASASSDSNVDYDRIAREIIAEAIATDEAEDEQHGDARGDELPPELQTEAGRREWLERELAREQAEGENEPAECVAEAVWEFDPEAIGRTGRRGWLREAHRHLEAQRWQAAQPIARSRAERLRLGARFLEDELDAECRGNKAYEDLREHRRLHDKRKLGGPTKPYTPPDVPAGEMNLTDPDSRRMKGNRRYIQGYNAQAVVNERADRARRRDHHQPDRLVTAATDARDRDRRTPAGRCHRQADGRCRRRPVLERAAHRPRRRRARVPGADPARRRQTAGRTTWLDRRPVRVHAARARN